MDEVLWSDGDPNLCVDNYIAGASGTRSIWDFVHGLANRGLSFLGSLLIRSFK